MARFDKPRVPKFGARPSSIKQPRSPEPDDYRKRRVVWEFLHADCAFDWRDEQHKAIDFHDVVGQLQNYERRTWGEIENDHKRDHPIPVPCDGLSKDAVDRLSQLRMDDIDELWRFRFGAKIRVWGVRFGHCFRVLWWDPQHKVYPIDIQDR